MNKTYIIGWKDCGIYLGFEKPKDLMYPFLTNEIHQATTFAEVSHAEYTYNEEIHSLIRDTEGTVESYSKPDYEPYDANLKQYVSSWLNDARQELKMLQGPVCIFTLEKTDFKQITLPETPRWYKNDK